MCGVLRFVLTSVLGVCAAGVVNVCAADGPARPNIVFILADDLGYTDLGCYGSKYYETPRLDRLAAGGVRFTSGYTCGPNCQPTRAALMSGQYGPRTGVYTVGNIDRFNWRSRSLRPVDNVVQLPLEKVTVAQVLKGAGYKTAIFGKWHLGEEGEYHPGRRGFDEAIVSMGRHFDFVTRPAVEVPEGAYLADFLTDKAVDFIGRHKDRPFFLYLSHFGVHSPYQAKREMIEKYEAKAGAGGHDHAIYAAMIASVDESVGRVRTALEQAGVAENTLIIFSSDNGGVGGYRREGLTRAGDVTDNAPLRGGKGMLYEGGIRVPYIFRWPAAIKPGAVCDVPVNSVDLYPTLLELAGVRPAADYPLDGASYVKVLTGGAEAGLDRGPLFWHFPGYLGSGEDQWRTLPVGVVRKGDFKLMEFFEDRRVELYNLREDIGERRNLAGEQPERVRELRRLLAGWRQRINAPMPTAIGATQPADDPVETPAEPRRERRGRRNRPGLRAAAPADAPPALATAG